MTTSIPAYTVDYTGTSPANLITNELQVLTGAAGDNFYFIVPEFAPYFAESLTITYTTLTGESSTLVAGIDYYPTNEFIGATRACAAAIYGSISFLNMSLIGSLSLTYQTLGGTWTQTSAEILAILAGNVRNPFITTWEQITNCPTIFPPVTHQWNLTDMVGMSDILAALNAMTDAIIAAGYDVATSHISNIDNPHQVTAAQIGAVTQAQLQQAVSTSVVSAVSYNTLALQLTGLEVGSITPITSTNTILQALANLQAQVTAGSTSTALANEITRAETAEAALSTSIGLAISEITASAIPLTGLTTGTNTPIIATNSILQALENIQAQILAGATVANLSWSNRSALRSMEGPVSTIVNVESLGIFSWFLGSTEPDDDETSFASTTGVWLLIATDPDFVFALWLSELDNVEGRTTNLETNLAAANAQLANQNTSIAAIASLGNSFLFAKFNMTLTSISGGVSSNFVFSVPGAQLNANVIANPGNLFGNSTTDQSCLSFIAFVSALNTVTVSIRNSSSIAVSLTASLWSVLVIN